MGGIVAQIPRAFDFCSLKSVGHDHIFALARHAFSDKIMKLYQDKKIFFKDRFKRRRHPIFHPYSKKADR
ncbi:hypothetical protein, partial [Helicobacter felis]|uniref:hypothetical protein n=1 Tax=Helicobacter felis TaxID=214 RepID=UPI001F19F4DE